MNNMNTNWMLQLQNLFGMGGNFNRNFSQNVPQYPPHCEAEGNTASSDSSCHTGSEGSEKEDSSCCCEPESEKTEEEQECECREPDPSGPCGYPQNSAFASFFGRDLFLPESASLPLKTDIPDVTQNISLCNDYSVALAPGYYAVYYYLSTEMKRQGFIELTPIFNDCGQTIYASRAETGSRKELLVISRYFIAEIPSASMLFFFAWNSSAGVSKINMNVSIEKLGRQ